MKNEKEKLFVKTARVFFVIVRFLFDGYMSS